MIFLTAPGGRLRVVVIDTDEHDRLKAANPLLTPDKSIMLAWTPDPAWLLQSIQTGPGTAQAIARAIDLAAKRPQAGTLLGPDGQPMMAAATEPEEKTVGDPRGSIVDLRTCLREMWEWQKGCQQLLPDGLAGRVKYLLGVE